MPLDINSDSACNISTLSTYVGIKIGSKEIILVNPDGEERSYKISNRIIEDGKVSIETEEGMKIQVELTDDQIKLL